MSRHDQEDPKAQRPQRPGQSGPGRPSGPRTGGGRFIWVLFFGLLILGVFAFINQARKARQEQITLDEFYDRLDRIEYANIRRNLVTGKYRNAEEERAKEFALQIHDAEVENLSRILREYNEAHPERRIKYEQDPGSEFIQFLLVQLLPILIILFILWYLLARQFRSAGGAGSVLSFGKARAKLHSKEQSNITFNDVAGVDEAKEDVEEIVEFLKSPGKFRRLGGRIPRGILLVGPPGCGKTLLAKAIAGEAEVPFFSISGSDFIEMFVGVGASRVRDLFRQAKDNTPCIIFLDEIDAVGRRRAIDLHGASAESAQTLNAILVEMDGFETDENIIVVAATNRPDVLDPALLRPGRFDRQVDVELPDIRGREAILKVHARKYKLAPDVNLRQLARGTPGFSGADLEAVLNEAALLATRKSKHAVAMSDLEESRDKVRWGRQKRSRVLSEEVRKTTAYHESGHAIAAKLLPAAQPLHKVSIIPQGRTLGMTMSLPEEDRYNVQRKELLDQLCMLMAGRIAEEMFCDDIDSGAQCDLDHATDIARSMVCRWGMSEAIGPVSFHEFEEPMFIGQEGIRRRPCSEATAVKIDEEISRLVHEAYARARELLGGHRDELERMAQALLKYEVLYAADVDRILAGKEVDRPAPNGPENESAPEEAAREAGEPADGEAAGADAAS